MSIKEEINNINKQTEQIKVLKLELEYGSKYEQLKARKNTFDKLYEAIEELKDYRECTSIGDKLDEELQPLWGLANRVDSIVELTEDNIREKGGEIIS